VQKKHIGSSLNARIPQRKQGLSHLRRAALSSAARLRLGDQLRSSSACCAGCDAGELGVVGRFFAGPLVALSSSTPFGGSDKSGMGGHTKGGSALGDGAGFSGSGLEGEDPKRASVAGPGFLRGTHLPRSCTWLDPISFTSARSFLIGSSSCRNLITSMRKQIISTLTPPWT
jgi:hypothetical protein